MCQRPLMTWLRQYKNCLQRAVQWSNIALLRWHSAEEFYVKNSINWITGTPSRTTRSKVDRSKVYFFLNTHFVPIVRLFAQRLRSFGVEENLARQNANILGWSLYTKFSQVGDRIRLRSGGTFLCYFLQTHSSVSVPNTTLSTCNPPSLFECLFSICRIIFEMSFSHFI